MTPTLRRTLLARRLVIAERLQHACEVTHGPADEARQRNIIRRRIALDRFRQFLNQIEPHRDVPARTIAGGGAFAPVASVLKQRRERAGAREEECLLAGGMRRAPK